MNDDGFSLINNNAEYFTEEINKLSRFHNLSILNSISLFCEIHEMDTLDVVPLIGTTMKEQMRLEEIKLNMINDKIAPSLFE